MDKLTRQLIDSVSQLMQIVNWSDLLERTFRPVIKPAPLLNGLMRAELIGYNYVSCPADSLPHLPRPLQNPMHDVRYH